MNYLLDTNMVIILFEGRYNKIRKEIKELINQPDTHLYASAISLNEIVQLVRKKRIGGIDYDLLDTPNKVLDFILRKTKGIITFLPYEPQYAKIVAKIDYAPKHNDPNDLSIIAHANGKKIPVISTDKMFPFYETFGVRIFHNPL